VITFDESYLKKYVHHDVFKDFSFLLTETVQPRVLEPALYDSLEILYRRSTRNILVNPFIKTRLSEAWW